MFLTATVPFVVARVAMDTIPAWFKVTWLHHPYRHLSLTSSIDDGFYKIYITIAQNVESRGSTILIQCTWILNWRGCAKDFFGVWNLQGVTFWGYKTMLSIFFQYQNSGRDLLNVNAVNDFISDQQNSSMISVWTTISCTSCQDVKCNCLWYTTKLWNYFAENKIINGIQFCLLGVFWFLHYWLTLWALRVPIGTPRPAAFKKIATFSIARTLP